MKVSVIMLTHNREQFVARMIQCVLSQTFRNLEYIIIDNGSTDQSGAIAEQYARSDPRVQVIHRPAGNIGSGRNAGLDAASGDFVTFVDDDDYLEPTYIEHLVHLTASHSAQIGVCGSWREVGGIRQPKFIFQGVYTYDGASAVCEMLKREKFNSGTPTKLISRAIFDHIRFQNEGKYDDIEMTYKILAHAGKTVVSGVPLYTFVRHERNNSIGTAVGEHAAPEQIAAYLDAFEKRTKWLMDRFPDQTVVWRHAEVSYALSMYDKTEDNSVRAKLKTVLISHASSSLRAGDLHTERDRELIHKYGGLFT